jgi:division protein CdvB (Snf7/Vps24/ESCRT-III family)
MSGQKDAIVDKFSARLKQAEAKIDLLKAKAEEADAETRLRLHRELEQLKSHKKELDDKLARLQKASGDAWRDLQAGTQAGWEAFSSAVERAVSRYS